MVEQITAMLGLLGVLSLLCQWIGWKLRLPAILPLLLCGLLLGPGLNILNPDAIFGDLLFPIISLGVAVILFEGAPRPWSHGDSSCDDWHPDHLDLYRYSNTFFDGFSMGDGLAVRRAGCCDWTYCDCAYAQKYQAKI